MYKEKENMTTEYFAIIAEINQHFGTQLEWKDSYLINVNLKFKTIDVLLQKIQ